MCRKTAGASNQQAAAPARGLPPPVKPPCSCQAPILPQHASHHSSLITDCLLPDLHSSAGSACGEPPLAGWYCVLNWLRRRSHPEAATCSYSFKRVLCFLVAACLLGPGYFGCMMHISSHTAMTSLALLWAHGLLLDVAWTSASQVWCLFKAVT